MAASDLTSLSWGEQIENLTLVKNEKQKCGNYSLRLGMRHNEIGLARHNVFMRSFQQALGLRIKTFENSKNDNLYVLQGRIWASGPSRATIISKTSGYTRTRSDVLTKTSVSLARGHHFCRLWLTTDSCRIQWPSFLHAACAHK